MGVRIGAFAVLPRYAMGDSQVPGAQEGVPDVQVHRECEIFRSDIGKLSEEFMPRGSEEI